jgi:hypothetical protein
MAKDTDTNKEMVRNGGKFVKGQPGISSGRPKGAIDKVTRQYQPKQLTKAQLRATGIEPQ